MADLATAAADRHDLRVECDARFAGRLEFVEVHRPAEAGTAGLQREELLRGDVAGQALDAIQKLLSLIALQLEQPPLQVEEERAQVERIVEIVGQHLQLQHLRVEVVVGGSSGISR